MTIALDTHVEPGVTYFYRLRVTDREGETSLLGLASARRDIESSLRMALGAPTPNPAVTGTTLHFRIGQAQPVKQTICDVSGRQVRTLAEGTLLSGEHTPQWDGRNERGEEVSAGIYFVRLSTLGGVKTQRVTIVR